MTITRDNISISFHAKGIPAGDHIEGYAFEDFFLGGMDWLDDDMATPDAVFAAAEAAYRGVDVAGVGIRIAVWTGEGFVKRNLNERR